MLTPTSCLESEDWQSEFIAKKYTTHAAQIRKHVVNGGVDGPQQSIQLYSALSRKHNAGGAVSLEARLISGYLV